MCPRGHLGGHFGNFGCPDPHLDPKRTQGPENVRFHRFPARTSSPFGGAFGAPFRHIFFRASGTLKKGGPGGPSKLDPFFGRFGDLPGGPQEGSLCSDSSTLTFAAEPKKGSILGAFCRAWVYFWRPWLHFWGFWRASTTGVQLWSGTGSLTQLGVGEGGGTKRDFSSSLGRTTGGDRRNKHLPHAC